MNKFLLSTAFGALALAAPGVAQAQNAPAAAVMVVDTSRIGTQCTACVAANAQVEAQIQGLQARARELSVPLQTEEQALSQALNALQGRNPDAALTARIQTFRTQQETAQQEIQARQAQVQRNVEFIRQQISERIRPAITQVAQQRRANLVLDASATLYSLPALDVTDAVLAVVNQNAAPFNVNAPAPQQQAPGTTGQTPPQQPPGR